MWDSKRRRLLLKFAASFARDPMHAEDLVQETFVKMLLHTERILPGREIAWAKVAIRNRAYNDARAASYDQKKTDRMMVEPYIQLSIPESLELQEQRKLIEQVFALMTPQHVQVLRLRHEDGLEPNEIAEALHIPIGTVSSRLSRAHTSFREISDIAFPTIRK